MKIQILRTDGSEEIHEGTQADIDGLIGADMLDFVNLRDGRMMAVDDIGYKKGLPVNEMATELYHAVRETDHEILGDVAIIPKS